MENNLKKSMFGYSKKTVLAFIADMDASYQQKLKTQQQETDTKYQKIKKENEENLDKIRKLEEKIASLQQENEILLQKSNDVSAIFIDAKRFSDELREKTKAEEAKKVEKLLKAYAEENQRLENYRAEIDALKETVRATMQAFDADLSTKKQLLSDTEYKFNASLTFNKTYRLIEE